MYGVGEEDEVCWGGDIKTTDGTDEADNIYGSWLIPILV